LVSAILRDNPPSVTDTRPDLRSDLARIVRRCLEKDPRHRVQTARDVSNEFRDLARQTSRCERDANEKEARAEKTYLSRVVPGHPAYAISGAFLPTPFSDHCDLKYLLDAVRASIYFRALNRIH
jgi:serine/threonine protein kinase